MKNYKWKEASIKKLIKEIEKRETFSVEVPHFLQKDMKVAAINPMKAILFLNLIGLIGFGILAIYAIKNNYEIIRERTLDTERWIFKPSSEREEVSENIEWPSISALKRKKKAELLEFAALLKIDALSNDNTKKEILEAIESKRKKK